MMYTHAVLLLLALPLSGCASRPDYTLNPPVSTEWVNVTVELPAYTEVMPMDVLYRSDKCQREDYDSTTESHVRKERGYNPQIFRMTQHVINNIWKGRIALDGGGKCEWKLSGIRVDIQLEKTLPLAAAKKIIPTSYEFAFDDDAYSAGEGSGMRKEAYNDLYIKTELFPVIIHHRDNEIVLKLFGGNTRKQQWSRFYRVHGVKNITIKPLLYIKKVVLLEAPKSSSAPAGMTITYPDGTVELKRAIIPDYDRLLSLK
ncbi:hypothetical protein MXM41_07575 [Leclercia adecarboxylata]|uniref:hypothetical protein n=1 Tax=Leclercia adecarboxylata TaxID=83655 RepID=UPI002DB6E4EA|nr:hypothetical protein [Leclercia adecarboxylata]MEB6378792.1 hypothetical protein [Leclercia adecarboxylata]